MGFLPHPGVSKRQQRWNRLLYKLVNRVTFGRVRLRFRKLPLRPLWSIETGADMPTPDEAAHDAMLGNGPLVAVGATDEGIVSLQRLAALASKYEPFPPETAIPTGMLSPPTPSSPQ